MCSRWICSGQTNPFIQHFLGEILLQYSAVLPQPGLGALAVGSSAVRNISPLADDPMNRAAAPLDLGFSIDAHVQFPNHILNNTRYCNDGTRANTNRLFSYRNRAKGWSNPCRGFRQSWTNQLMARFQLPIWQCGARTIPSPK